MASKSGYIVRLKTPESVKATGRPECMVVTKDGHRYELPWGADFRLSSHCDPENRVANLDAKGGYPLLHKDFYERYKSQFEIISEEDNG